MFSGSDSFISVKYHHVYPVPKIFWNRYTQKMHNDNDTYYVQTTNTTIFFFHLFFLFLLSWLFPDISGFFKEGEGMLLLKRGHVNYQYLLAHMVSNIKLILILLFCSLFFYYYPQYLIFLFFLLVISPNGFATSFFGMCLIIFFLTS